MFYLLHINNYIVQLKHFNMKPQEVYIVGCFQHQQTTHLDQSYFIMFIRF